MSNRLSAPFILPDASAGPARPRVAIAGGGVVGLVTAWTLAERGARVTIYDPAPPGRGASWAAAGMLAPAFEAGSETGAHPRLFDLCQRAAALWPDFAAHLAAAVGTDASFDAGPSLALASSREGSARLNRLADRLAAAGLPHARLDPETARAREPAIGPAVRGALFMPTDGQVDNRRLVRALEAVCRAHPRIALVSCGAPLVLRQDRVGVAGADATVVAAGWESARLPVQAGAREVRLGALSPAMDALVPVAGQMLSVAPPPDGPRHTLREGALYLVPKADRLVIGATVEHGRVLAAPDPATVARLKADAARLCPGVARAPTLESWAGTRPGTPDHAPMIGHDPASGCVVAAGHYRNGILLAPLTGLLVGDLLLGGSEGAAWADFSPERFAPATA